MELLKGKFSHYGMSIITEWDEPTVRTRSDGVQVIGRPTRGFGDGGTFSYAGKDYSPEPWTEEMRRVREWAEAVTTEVLQRDVNFTFCLAGLYPTGEDGIPFHSDTVPTLDDVVLSISLGAPRVFTNRIYPCIIKDHSNTSNVYEEEIDDMEIAGEFDETMFLMEHGDAIIFDGHSQMNTRHCVPPVTGVGPRMNLTFRTGL